MKKTNLYGEMPVLFRVAFFLLISLSLFLFFGCEEDEPEEDMSISEITITNIPANIPIKDSNPVSNKAAFKIYLNASDSQSASDAPVAKGVAKFSDGSLKDGKHSIKIKLQKPNSETNKDPNLDTGSWSGTANYFSVMISPQTVSGKDDVWMKAGVTLDKGKKECSWDSLFDSRTNSMISPEQVEALYTGIICQDPEITKK